MINFELLFKNETVEEIITFFAGYTKSIGYPTLDRCFVRYRFSAIETGEFMNTFHVLCEKEVISLNDKMGLIKGPKWQPPAFETQKKYGIE